MHFGCHMCDTTEFGVYLQLVKYTKYDILGVTDL